MGWSEGGRKDVSSLKISFLLLLHSAVGGSLGKMTQGTEKAKKRLQHKSFHPPH